MTCPTWTFRLELRLLQPLRPRQRIVQPQQINWNACPPVQFDITEVSDGRSIAIDRFSTYVEGLLPIPDDVQPDRITTAVAVDPDGSVHHVPTRIVNVDGRWYTSIKSLSNSSYMLVRQDQTFTDITSSWAGSSIENMGNRLIVSGTGDGQFQPQRAITRAEIATILERLLRESGLI